MDRINIKFYDSLNKLLKKDKRGKKLSLELKLRQSVKDLIEAQGIPHTEVGMIIIDGKKEEFSFILKDGQEIEVYPAFNHVEEPKFQNLINYPKKFILDVHLGRLAKYLRIFGIDTLYQNYYSDKEIVETALKEGRVILTRDRGILKRRVVRYGYLIKSNDSKEQLREIFLNFHLLPEIKPFLRCISCNGILERVSKGEIMEELEPLTRKYYNEFLRCTMCKKIYWKGGHMERMEEFADKFLCSLRHYKKNGPMEKYNKEDIWKN
ncbi:MULTISPECIES: Mut7-C RNAse domain-containing protein [Psychrilyobacter]|uniref:Twitching motility protein PilT n=1 Tax=Psychrilyobacter piezotolerans TaxID=2293438 RepID=A0ABX9KHS3_9FUSO|nr:MULTISPECIES: Mut7-C RNAse domain-containing protein [Psychrilyobacter]MCS5422541.1 Mut7-C ubiquitin/RNAse domain-containing protein [Psychrilyobacter sp. S5]NDI77968.1 twitching motility protein PilT [Psychrilyobacter piezotolerans]RDE62082.1 twitching motility protein PilT [Psychrilyobacter sp. S5]REI41329.1 twitching motility protein PilT [Psychrilyobacter piezotolerans]